MCHLAPLIVTFYSQLCFFLSAFCIDFFLFLCWFRISMRAKFDPRAIWRVNYREWLQRNEADENCVCTGRAKSEQRETEQPGESTVNAALNTENIVSIVVNIWRTEEKLDERWHRQEGIVWLEALRIRFRPRGLRLENWTSCIIRQTFFSRFPTLLILKLSEFYNLASAVFGKLYRAALKKVLIKNSDFQGAATGGVQLSATANQFVDKIDPFSKRGTSRRRSGFFLTENMGFLQTHCEQQQIPHWQRARSGGFASH